jgi:hypothetical protein
MTETALHDADVPAPGQLVTVRNRVWVTSDVVRGTTAHDRLTSRAPHLVDLVSIEDDARELDAFLDAVRWGATASADRTVLQAPLERSGPLRLRGRQRRGLPPVNLSRSCHSRARVQATP